MKLIGKTATRLRSVRDARRDEKIYADNLRKCSFTSSENKPAVIIHLFYPEMWPVFVSVLDRLSNVGLHFGLYVTVPATKMTAAQKAVLATHPDTILLSVPNRGRDVLPFLKVMQIVSSQKHPYFLKLHSKKSLQRQDGAAWTEELFDKLVPVSKGTLLRFIETLKLPDTAIIGPENNYLPLNIYYQDNRKAILKVITDIFDTATAAVMDTNQERYGFFAGTMFWGRTTAIQDIIVQDYRSNRFQEELAQLDGTFAHALERLFSIVPELRGLKMYETDGMKLTPRDYRAIFTQEQWDLKAANKV